MQPASWSPPIPAGAVAVREWRRLNRRTRRELLRAGAPHPDPMAAAVAVPADPQALLGRIPAGRVRAARRAAGIYGSPVAIPDPGLDRTGEDIAAAAAALAGLPVRRFGGR